MMTPDLISVVRRKLRDFGTKQGSANSLLYYTVFRNNFWSDNEILLALNIAQNLIVRQAVRQKNSSIFLYSPEPSVVQDKRLRRSRGSFNLQAMCVADRCRRAGLFLLFHPNMQS